jgi:hypothetical protein
MGKRLGGRANATGERSLMRQPVPSTRATCRPGPPRAFVPGDPFEERERVASVLWRRDVGGVLVPGAVDPGAERIRAKTEDIATVGRAKLRVGLADRRR